MQNTKSLLLTRSIVIFIIFVQLVLGVIFIFAPSTFPQLMGLAPAPAWTEWIFGQYGARCLGFALGLGLALSDLQKNATWLVTMILVQTIDWVVTVVLLADGTLHLSQVATAPFLPLIFIAVLVIELKRQRNAIAAKNQPKSA